MPQSHILAAPSSYVGHQTGSIPWRCTGVYRSGTTLRVEQNGPHSNETLAISEQAGAVNNKESCLTSYLGERSHRRDFPKRVYSCLLSYGFGDLFHRALMTMSIVFQIDSAKASPP